MLWRENVLMEIENKVAASIWLDELLHWVEILLQIVCCIFFSHHFHFSLVFYHYFDVSHTFVLLHHLEFLHHFFFNHYSRRQRHLFEYFKESDFLIWSKIKTKLKFMKIIGNAMLRKSCEIFDIKNFLITKSWFSSRVWYLVEKYRRESRVCLYGFIGFIAKAYVSASMRKMHYETEIFIQRIPRSTLSKEKIIQSSWQFTK